MGKRGKAPQRPMKGFSKLTFDSDDEDASGSAVA